MRVLFYISTIAGGGAGRVMANLANMLCGNGHECTLVTTFKAEGEYTLESGVRRVWLYDTKPGGSLLSKNFAIIRKLRSWIRIIKPDVVVSFLGEPNIRTVIATIGIGVKTVLSVRNDPSREYKGKLQVFLAKTIFKRADAIVFQTEDAKAWFPSKIQQKGVVIPNSVDERFFKTQLSENRSGIVAIGRLCPQKNHSMLIEAFSMIAGKTDENLTIYGPGDSSHLKELARKLGVGDRVFFPGPTADVPAVLAKAKIYVLSSDYEGMPNSLMEAMAIGLPCISTNCPCGGPRDLFGDELRHFLVSLGDVKEMSDRMVELLNSSIIKEKHANACRLRARLFKPETINSKWEAALLKIVLI